MKYPSLRHVVDAECHARAALALWPRRDAALIGRLAYAPLPNGPSVYAVQAYRKDRCWRGYVDLAEWLANTAPELASLACAADASTEHVRHLFAASAHPVDMPLPELGYDMLQIEHNPEQSLAQSKLCLLSILTPQGRVWLSEFPQPIAPVVGAVSASMQALPLLLAWHLGSSSASRRLVADLRRGDVLLIGCEAFELTSAGRVIGRFSINEDGEISVQATTMNELKEATTQDHVEAHTAPTVAITMGDIPLRLDFILQRRTMTVAQLDALYRGQVLSLDPQAEQQVEITVNGMRLATGELVELNGRLGIELHDIAVGTSLAEAHRV
ncbi:type III secretion system cytoplasmic ring protein SctQ [Solimicrobium silvestre]|uniref:Surface presentation of antigens protein SpaO n=1 Tax=Solimicrobium silvestre TaxID=2099400 RepID=A0A2S9H1P3_9BURK|nr:type III secretion system cytoplasmic ring protein SctQ [Solimicrobium silvestre]PRC93863.1 Type III secretion apparatus protein, YscQ/HrcQ family [Solimicrobium silvestre]